MHPADNTSRTIVLGMGNTLLGDDGVGILIARRAKALLAGNPQVCIEETEWGGFRIIDLLSGFRRAIIVDAVKTGAQSPGFIHLFEDADLVHSVRMVSFHDVNFATAVAFARQMEIPMPRKISVYAIEVDETTMLREGLSSQVQAAVDTCARLIISQIRSAHGGIAKAGSVAASRPTYYQE
jgi:hydrogenase maturation protease